MALITSHRVGVAGRDGKDGDGGFFERVQGKEREGEEGVQVGLVHRLSDSIQADNSIFTLNLLLRVIQDVASG